MTQKENNKPLVSVILLNWNGIRDTLDCLTSLNNVSYPNIKIIVVDNASKDSKEASIIKNSFPQIELIRSLKNLGFSGGNNLGIKSALNQKSDYILLLNNER